MAGGRPTDNRKSSVDCWPIKRPTAGLPEEEPTPSWIHPSGASVFLRTPVQPDGKIIVRGFAPANCLSKRRSRWFAPTDSYTQEGGAAIFRQLKLATTWDCRPTPRALSLLEQHLESRPRILREHRRLRGATMETAAALRTGLDAVQPFTHTGRLSEGPRVGTATTACLLAQVVAKHACILNTSATRASKQTVVVQASKLRSLAC